jgi:galactokinase/mevalonate kinase-like predicted kinase
MAVCGRGKHGGAIRDGGSTSLPSFRSRSGGEIVRAAINHYVATSARLQ